MWFPEVVDVPEAQRATGVVGMRFEDITQDGMLKVGGMPHALGMIGFRKLFAPTPLNRRTREQGIVPILSTLHMEGREGPVAVGNEFPVEASYEVGHSLAPDESVDRIMLNMRAEVRGTRGVTHGPQPEGAGDLILAGRVYAEHVFTRPWGPREERQVRSLDLGQGPFVPPAVIPFRPPVELLTPPAPVRWEGDEVRDPTPLCFGMSHTDSNQHVNSLIYPQLFEDAVLRALAARGEDIAPLLVRSISLGFRKPCFAGEQVRIALRLFRCEERWGAVAWLGTEGVALERAHCFCRLRF